MTQAATSSPSKMARNVAIAGQIAAGKDIAKVAAENNLSKRQTYRILSDKQCKDILEHVARVNIAHAKGINKQFIQLCYDKDKKIRLDAIKQYQKNVGISPSHTTNLFIQSIYQDNRNMIPQDVESLLELLSGQSSGDDVVDAELIPD